MHALSPEISALLNRASTKKFLEAARMFIDLLENETLSAEVFYRKAHVAIADLYSTGLNLEPVEIKFSSEKSEFEGVEKESLKTMNKALIAKLGLDSYYWEVYDPTIGSDKEPTQGWLVDDFADMYADLKNELHKIEHVRTDEAIEDALWQLKFGFTHHWGIHCVCAMRALHFLWYPGKEAM